MTAEEIVQEAVETITELQARCERLDRMLYEERREHAATKRYYEERIQQITQRVNVLPPL